MRWFSDNSTALTMSKLECCPVKTVGTACTTSALKTKSRSEIGSARNLLDTLPHTAISPAYHSGRQLPLLTARDLRGAALIAATRSGGRRSGNRTPQERRGRKTGPQGDGSESGSGSAETVLATVIPVAAPVLP